MNVNHKLNCRYEIKWSNDPRSYERNFSNYIESVAPASRGHRFKPCWSPEFLRLLYIISKIAFITTKINASIKIYNTIFIFLVVDFLSHLSLDILRILYNFLSRLSDYKRTFLLWKLLENCFISTVSLYDCQMSPLVRNCKRFAPPQVRPQEGLYPSPPASSTPPRFANPPTPLPSTFQVRPLVRLECEKLWSIHKSSSLSKRKHKQNWIFQVVFFKKIQYCRQIKEPRICWNDHQSSVLCDLYFL